MWTLIIETVRIVEQSAIYLLFGFALAGLLHVALRRTPGFMRLLSERGGKSVVLAALFGVPLPLCSCSVIPAGLTLRRKGASKGATVSFLISVPETDVISILLTYGLIGPVMAVARPIAALVTAVVTGQLANVVDRWTQQKSEAAQESCCCSAGNDSREYNVAKGPIWNLFHYGFVQFFDDIIGSLTLGLILGGLITAFLPSLHLERLAGSSILTMLAMLLVGIPMYVCATASTPIAAGLIAGGISPGAALVFLLAGPATNLGSILVLVKQLGRPVLITYLACIAAVSVLMGLWLDAAFGVDAFLPAVPSAAAAHQESFSILNAAGAIVLVVLTILSFRRTGKLTQFIERIGRLTGLRVQARYAKTGCVLGLVALYAASGLFVVGPGQRGVDVVFGRIARSYLPPGLYYTWPHPLGRADIESVAEVKTLELGFRRSAASAAFASMPGMQTPTDVTRESWMLTGHEDIVDVRWVVHYQVADSRQQLEDYLYGVADPAMLLRSAADSAIRTAVGARSIDTILTTDRQEIGRAVHRELQATLDRCQSGIQVLYVGLEHVHAPEEVHWAFRDVASAGEEKMTTINEAQEYEGRIVPQAEGERQRRVLAADAKAVELTQQAEGDATAFKVQQEAYRNAPAITRLRLYLEAVDATLPSLRKYVSTSQALDRLVDLWLISGDNVASPERRAIPPEFLNLSGDEEGRFRR